MKNNELKQLYFSHDIYADKDEKIVKMFYHFRKTKFTDEFLRRNFFHAAFGLFWEIVQYMHRNELTVDEIPMLADELRADEDFVRSIIMDFNLFRIEDNKIVSDRILRNLNYVEQKNEDKKQAANVRWLLSAFDKYYLEFFKSEPVLQPNEIETLKSYSKKIPNLKDKLRDIIYTLHELKFDKDINFKPCANWLLTKNNLARLVNGEFGQLKHKKTEKELKEEQRQFALEETQRNKPSEFELKIKTCSGKAEALEIIAEEYEGKKFPMQKGKAYVIPPLRKLMEKFDITDKEVIELCQP